MHSSHCTLKQKIFWLRVSGCSKHSFRHKTAFSKWCSEWVSGTIKTGSVPTLTDFFLLCVLKSTFFRRRVEMHKGFESKGHMGRKTSTWKWGNILSTFSENLQACAIETCIFYVSEEAYINIYIMIYWHIYIYMNTKLSISCGDPHT